MQVAVWDTYVTKQNGTIMNFDIIVPKEQKDEQLIRQFGRQYLASKSLSTSDVVVNQCAFCHIEQASDKMVKSILETGYFILELRNCN
ncbi:DUF2024 family protein [Pseudochryseolinea flava]|uniref:DUF2024 domain-containing protein n=1 Tax=Pseudochryseolinea flava TaxID=2059302 RepID=A0A364Y365_9BACT|nr:DUF2024 family protein [Pseudochryseolinea flava]RAW00586.1 DUF2024 domain-containing protein [Pseudochryseolinea flava]